MTTISLSRANLLSKSALFLLFFIMETAIFAILPLSMRIPASRLVVFQAVLSAAFLLAAFLLRRSSSGAAYWQVFYVFFVGAAAVLVSTLYSGDLIRLFGFTPTNPQGIAMAKLAESTLRVTVLLVLMAVTGADRSSLYLIQGRLGLGLAVGVPAFLILAAVAFVPLASQAGMPDKLLSLAPWILLFVFSNSLMEELLYRGLFLQRYEAFLGKSLAILLTAIVFTLIHAQVDYVSDVLQFLLIIFPLALIWGFLMQKTGSLWGSVLFHAGADCIIILGIFASYQ